MKWQANPPGNSVALSSDVGAMNPFSEASFADGGIDQSPTAWKGRLDP
jgi:hypothetical protein